MFVILIFSRHEDVAFLDKRHEKSFLCYQLNCECVTMKEKTIDLKNYMENGTVFKRTAVRGIIRKNEQIPEDNL